MLIVLVAVACYLLGAIPFGYLVAKFSRGIDIRQHGSGNIGATNVGRVLGLKWFFVVFTLDFLKAAVPVTLLMYGKFPALVPEGWPNSALASVAGLTILVGNMYPVYLGFRGGKGAATGTGVIVPLAPIPAISALTIFFIVFTLTRYVSLGSLLASLGLVVTHLAMNWTESFRGEAAPVTWLCLVGAALVIFRHRGNIVRLFRGTENKIPRRRKRMNPAQAENMELVRRFPSS